MRQTLAVLAIDRIQDAFDNTAGGKVVTIYGQHFESPITEVTFDDEPGINITLLDQGRISVETPAQLAAGYMDVTVTSGSPAATHAPTRSTTRIHPWITCRYGSMQATMTPAATKVPHRKLTPGQIFYMAPMAAWSTSTCLPRMKRVGKAAVRRTLPFAIRR